MKKKRSPVRPSFPFLEGSGELERRRYHDKQRTATSDGDRRRIV